MKHTIKSFLLVILLLCLLLSMTGCTPKLVDVNDYLVYEADPPRPVTSLTTVVTADTIGELEQYPALERLDLTGSTCYEELYAYRLNHPQVKVKYTVDILGKEYSLDTISINLADMPAEQIDTVGPLLKHFPDLKLVELMKADGTSSFSVEQAKALQTLAPGVPFNYYFDLFGQKLSFADDKIELVDVPVYDSGLEQIKAAMAAMPNLTTVRLDNCGTTSPAMNQLRVDNPNLEVHWRVWFGKYNCMTDETVLRLTNGLKDSHIGELKYCIKGEYVDIGHNETLTDISWLQYMPNLKLLIASGTNVSDITPLKGLKHLEWLELVFCANLKDLTPLSESTGLKFLNISMTGVSQLDALKDIRLERMVALSMTYLQQSEREEFAAAHNDCLRVWYGTQPYGYGWRYSDQGYTFYKYYVDMREIFDYDDKYKYTGKYYTGKRIQPETPAATEQTAENA